MASDSLAQLAAKLEILADDRVPAEVERITRQVALQVDQTAVLATPVDKGQARAGWLVTTGSPATTVPDPVESGERGSEARRSANTQKALEQGRAALAAYDLRRGAIFVTNNVRHIQFLEEGGSAQAPAGMLRAALEAGIRTARRNRVRLRAGLV